MSDDIKSEIGGNYLGQVDVDKPTAVTLEWTKKVDIQGEEQPKRIIKFREFEKPMIMNKTNLRMLAHIHGNTVPDSWKDPVMLYVDPDIEFGGKIVGGLRFRRVNSTGVGGTPLTDEEIPF